MTKRLLSPCLLSLTIRIICHQIQHTLTMADFLCPRICLFSFVAIFRRPLESPTSLYVCMINSHVEEPADRDSEDPNKSKAHFEGFSSLEVGLAPLPLVLSIFYL